MKDNQMMQMNDIQQIPGYENQMFMGNVTLPGMSQIEKMTKDYNYDFNPNHKE
jgi:hypothetical protein